MSLFSKTLLSLFLFVLLSNGITKCTNDPCIITTSNDNEIINCINNIKICVININHNNIYINSNGYITYISCNIDNKCNNAIYNIGGSTQLIQQNFRLDCSGHNTCNDITININNNIIDGVNINVLNGFNSFQNSVINSHLEYQQQTLINCGDNNNCINSTINCNNNNCKCNGINCPQINSVTPTPSIQS